MIDKLKRWAQTGNNGYNLMLLLFMLMSCLAAIEWLYIMDLLDKVLYLEQHCLFKFD